MCVTVAIKLPRDRKTGKPAKDAKWRLAKIRDRAYDPEYTFRRFTDKKNNNGLVQQIFLVDSDSDWTEGLSVSQDGKFFGIMNSALNNSDDLKDGKDKAKSADGPIANNGIVVRNALKSSDIKNAIKSIKDNKFDGCTFVSDGNTLFLIESTLPADIKKKYRDKKISGKKFTDIVPADEYATEVHEIKDDYMVVRTNHGVYNETMGYQPKDGDKYKSSVKRREYAIDAIEKNVFESHELLPVLARLGREEIDKNPFFRPIRRKEELEKAGVSPLIYSTSIIQLDPSGTMIVKPIECKFENYSFNQMSGEKYLTHMVLLPAKSKMYE